MSAGWRSIAVERTGGFAGLTLQATVTADDDEADRFGGLLAGVDLPGLAAQPDEPVADGYSYALRVDTADGAYALVCGERALPGAVRPLVRALEQRASRRPPGPADPAG